MKKLNNEIIGKILLVFLIIQPFFDLSFFYGQIATLIRIIIILSLFILTIKLDKDSKLKKYLFGYLFVVIIYFIFHDINARKLTSLIPGNFDYNTFSEALYFLKMIMNILLIYTVYKVNLTLKDFNVPINIGVLLISVSIVILNFLTLSYSAYGFEIISANFFIWFTDHNYIFDDLASKGYFELANQIVAILILYLPLVVYFFLKKFKPLNIITLIIMLLSLLMLGTRISIYGSLFVLIFILIIYIFFAIIRKEKFKLSRVLVLIGLGIMFTFIIDYSPVKLKQNYYENIYEQDKNIVQEDPVTDEDKEKAVDLKTKKQSANNDQLEYILTNYEAKLIFKEFILYSYPYQYDPDFWIKIMNEDVTKRVDTRYLETEMVKRVIEINDNKLDLSLGIGYNRIMNIFNIERDYIMQYYSLGIIGLILLIGPYFLIIIFSIIKILLNFKTKFNFTNIVLLSCVSIFLFSAYFSGNILNGLGCIIPISLICGVLLKEVNYVRINEEKN